MTSTFDAGFQMHLEKPFVPAVILSAVASLATLPVNEPGHGRHDAPVAA